MQVILHERIEGLGNRGDLVDVADGYARNSLIPGQKASLATKGAVQHAETMARSFAKKDANEKDLANKLAGTASAEAIAIAVKVGKDEKLFGSIGPSDVAEALTESLGQHIDRKSVVVEEPFKTLGTFTAQFNPHPEVSTDITVELVAE